MTFYPLYFIAAKMWNVLLTNIVQFISWTAFGAAAEYIKPGSGAKVNKIEVVADVITGNFGSKAGILTSLALDSGFLGGWSAIKYFFLKRDKKAIFRDAVESMTTSGKKTAAKEFLGPLFKVPLDRLKQFFGQDKS